MDLFTPLSKFQQALAESGLVEPAALEAAVHNLATAGGLVNDASLAEQLIRTGMLNAWQVQQLHEGRTKFALGPYVILDSLGRGGMGHVFKGRHDLLGRVEAIKVLPKHRSTPEAIAAFRHEIRTQAQLDHPNLVRVSYADRDGDTYFLVTELIPGADLRRIVRRLGPLPFDVAADAIHQAAEGLEHAHRRGLVHRDVKPGNMLVTPTGHLKLTDLGLAWFLDGEGQAGHGNGKVVGTSDYLPPEAIRTPDRIMPVSDIYALGASLYYAVTGKVPFPGGNPVDKMRRRLQETPRSPLHFAPNLPPELVRLIETMMHPEHAQRTPTAAAAAQALAVFIKPDSRAKLAALVADIHGHTNRSVGGLADTVDGAYEVPDEISSSGSNDPKTPRETTPIGEPGSADSSRKWPRSASPPTFTPIAVPTNDLPAPPTLLDSVVQLIAIAAVTAAVLLLLWAIWQGM